LQQLRRGAARHDRVAADARKRLQRLLSYLLKSICETKKMIAARAITRQTNAISMLEAEDRLDLRHYERNTRSNHTRLKPLALLQGADALLVF
jgi:hypothetical protein